MAKELIKLKKLVDAERSDLTPDQLNIYVNQFQTISGNLNAGAQQGDLDEVERQANRLNRLAQELAVHLATKPKAKGKAETRLGEVRDTNLDTETARVADLIASLEGHEQAPHINDEIQALRAALNGIDPDDDYDVKIAAFDAIDVDIAAAMTLASAFQQVCDLRADVDRRVEALRQRNENGHLDGEILAVSNGMDPACALAELPRREYANARQALEALATQAGDAETLLDQYRGVLGHQVAAD